MRITLLSDLHLGVKGDVSNRFMVDETVFSQYLTRLLSTNDLIILVGDTFELWEGLFDPHHAIKLMDDKIKARFEEIVNSWSFMDTILHNDKILLISGNHDAFLRTKHLLPENKVRCHHLLNLIDKQIMITHGHQGDCFNSDKSPLRCISCLCQQSLYGLDELLNISFDDDICKLAQTLFANEQSINKYADKLAKTGNYQLVIFGHTHNRGVWHIGHNYYINTGCVVGKPTVIDELTIESDDIKRAICVSSHEIDLSNYGIHSSVMVNM